MLSAPVTANDEIIAALVLAARDPKAYKKDSLELATATAKIITPKIKDLRLNMDHT